MNEDYVMGSYGLLLPSTSRFALNFYLTSLTMSWEQLLTEGLKITSPFPFDESIISSQDRFHSVYM